MTPSHLSMSHEGKETLLRIVEGLEGVTPGPWTAKEKSETPPIVQVFGPSEIVCGDDGICEAERFNDRSFEEDAANMRHLARCHPDAIRAIAEYLAALEAERDELKAGIKRLSDEEELINETGRDGMLSAVHIGARLAEAEELARAMEAEANQMREVSIFHRNRAEALEESLKTVLASLVATTSLIIRAEDLKVKPSKAVASDKMFTQMLKDYDKATIAGRAALSTPPAAPIAVDFEAALDAFWNVAYTQGQEQGRHDDDEGTAQKAEDDLRRAIAALSASPSPVDSRG